VRSASKSSQNSHPDLGEAHSAVAMPGATAADIDPAGPSRSAIGDTDSEQAWPIDNRAAPAMESSLVRWVFVTVRSLTRLLFIGPLGEE
jgi:hypothetical protein